MSQNTYCSPRLYIKDVDVLEDISGQVIFPGNNQINSMSIKLSGINLPESALQDKEIRFYLNYGGEDTVPFFIGYIKEIKSGDTSTQITAYDSRCKLGGQYAEAITLTDFDNYDGHTLGQFLHKYIKDVVNKDNEYFDLSQLNDTNPPVPFKEIRDTDSNPYSLVIEAMERAIDDSDIFDILDYEINTTFTTTGTGLKFIKQKPIDKSSITLSYGDGISSYTYKKRKIPNRGIFNNISVDYGNNNSPKVSKDVAAKMVKNLENKDVVSRAFLSKEILKGLIKARNEKFEINVVANKGHYLQLGSIVNMNVDEEIKGNHRLVGKRVTFSKVGVNLSLNLNTHQYKY